MSIKTLYDLITVLKKSIAQDEKDGDREAAEVQKSQLKLAERLKNSDDGFIASIENYDGKTVMCADDETKRFYIFYTNEGSAILGYLTTDEAKHILDDCKEVIDPVTSTTSYADRIVNGYKKAAETNDEFTKTKILLQLNNKFLEHYDDVYGKNAIINRLVDDITKLYKSRIIDFSDLNLMGLYSND